MCMCRVCACVVCVHVLCVCMCCVCACVVCVHVSCVLPVRTPSVRSPRPLLSASQPPDLDLDPEKWPGS